MGFTGAAVDPDQAAAVWVRGAHHEYQRHPFESTEPVFRCLDMTVRRCEVYALLGPSGCGKTTLLRALVGQHVLDAGEVLVFGRPPGHPEGGVPGNAVGYMPQEVAVHDGFTIGETLSFHGRLMGMSSVAIEARTSSLVAQLGLPPNRTLVGALSGGQKRRVSLAMALLHYPQLLILDEPTVGADPELRHSIWQLLLAAAAEGTTVVISTHYTEEARNANTVGLLWSGRMVLEDDPAVVLERYRPPVGACACAELEAAVRALCALLDQGGQYDGDGDLASRRPQLSRPKADRHTAAAPLKTKHKLAALLWKNCIYLWRHSTALAAQAVFFVFITVLACVVIGHWPHAVRVDVVNEDANCTAGVAGPGGLGEPLSCTIIGRLPKRGLEPVLQRDVEVAWASVRSGRSWGVLHFASNFSPALVDRLAHQTEEDAVLEASTLHAHLDTTDFVVSNMVSRRLVEVMCDVMDMFSPSMCNLIRIEEPIFGRREPVNTETLMPGVLLGYMTTFAASLIMSTLLTEKMDKFMERTLVAGVRMSELMTCWTAVLFPVVLVVNLISHVIIFGPLAIPCAGSIALMFLLCSALCLMTMVAGLLFASMFDNYITAILSCHQFAVSFIFLSGVLWPLQAMHWSLRWLALVMPWSHSMEAARAVLQRGWGLTHLQVWLGFASCAVWTGVFLVGLVLVHRPKRGRLGGLPFLRCRS